MLKRLFFLPLLFIFTMLCFTEANAQRILGAVSLGMNLTQVDGDDFFGFHKIGLNVGPMVAVPFGRKKNWSVSMELLYSQKGSFHNGAVDSTTYKLVQDYAEIPVLVHFTDKKLVSGGVGFSYGQLINYKETSNSFYDKVYVEKSDLSNYDFSIIGDFQIRLWSKLWANFRYQYSLMSNRQVTVEVPYSYPRVQNVQQQYNNVISIRLTWVFNQEKISKRPKQQSGVETF